MSFAPQDIRSDVIQKLRSLKKRQPLDLPLIDPFELRSGQEVAERIIVVYCLAGIGNDNNIDPAKLWAWLGECKIQRAIPKEEVGYLNGSVITETDSLQLGWLKESLFTLAWCGGLVPSLPLPYREADLTPVFSRIPPEVGADAFIQSFRLRPIQEIAFELDFYYCAHWLEKHRRMFSFDRQFSKDVIVERRRAFEWVCAPSINWHEISLDT